jgi:hypothetical protein
MKGGYDCLQDLQDATTAALPTLEELRRHVLEVLCSHDRLDPKQTPLHQAVFWQAQGPRRVRGAEDGDARFGADVVVRNRPRGTQLV